jgi:hypothetical protein
MKPDVNIMYSDIYGLLKDANLPVQCAISTVMWWNVTEVSIFLDCDPASVGQRIPTFRRNVPTKLRDRVTYWHTVISLESRNTRLCFQKPQYLRDKDINCWKCSGNSLSSTPSLLHSSPNIIIIISSSTSSISVTIIIIIIITIIIIIIIIIIICRNVIYIFCKRNGALLITWNWISVILRQWISQGEQIRIFTTWEIISQHVQIPSMRQKYYQFIRNYAFASLWSTQFPWFN